MQSILSERQRAAVAAALTILAAFVIVTAVGALVWLVSAFVKAFSSVFLPLAVAGVLALVLQPYYAWFRERRRVPAALALVAVFLSILVPVALFVWFFGHLVATQLAELVSKVPGWWRAGVEQVQTRWPELAVFIDRAALVDNVRAAIEGREEDVVHGLQLMGGKAFSFGAIVLRGLGAVLGWAVFPVYLAFFLMAEPVSADELEENLPFLKPETRRDLLYLAKEFVNIVVAFFRGQLLIAFLQGVLYAVGFTLVGLDYGLLLGLVLGFLNIIPYLGSIVGLGVALPLGFFQSDGGGWLVIAVLVVFTVVQMIEGYVLTPKIMGDRTGLHPLAIIVAVFFWGAALDGLMGMVLAIPLTAFLVVFWRLAREKYIAELV